ncbi:MAG: 16S rRNA (cytosine(967)-C(5))-methyltransferase RsmB [Lachnospiraceae bacterium]|nr:16S rRNA (cytosine(967)-C(5))-methyltransferase RsmB [Lachnospiraceae bacterium]
MANERDIVLDILMDIEDNNTFSNIALNKALKKNQFIEKKERAFITRLSEGVVETRIKLDYIINQFSKTKSDKLKSKIRCIIRMGVYQLLFMDSVPDSAACNEAVKLAKKHGFSGLSGFVNGVLRNIAKNKDNISYPSEEDNRILFLSVKYSMPEMLIKKFMTDYPDTYMNILEGCFDKRETSIRIDLNKISRDELKKELTEQGINAVNGQYSDKVLLISGYDFIKRIFGYKQGYFTVQDESSVCAIAESFKELTKEKEISEDFTALDICAAPGGKTTAALEYMNNQGMIYSMDISEDKLSLIEENIERLGFKNAKVAQHDALEHISKDLFDYDFDDNTDLVIADVPCSGLGIIGRKNDIKYRVTKEQIDELIDLQKRIINNAASYVKKNGLLLYSTCTVNPDENDVQVDRFLKNKTDFSLVGKRQFVQGTDKCDGFFYAIMKRV